MKYLIIGNGTAGTSAALSIRKNDPHGNISIISGSKHLHYYRPRLIEYLQGSMPFEKLVLYREDFYRNKNIENILNTRIVSINTREKSISDSSGKEFFFDKLLIAAGAKSFTPPINGIRREDVFTLRGAADADQILNRCSEVTNIAVIGGGLLGLETANSLYLPGRNITVIEFSDWLLPRQLDRDGGIILKDLLQKKSINFLTGESVLSINGENDNVEKIILKSGKQITAEAVIISAGIRPNLELAESAHLEVNNGIIVNNYLETSKREIFAAGDASEYHGRCYGLWPAAKKQGEIAGMNMSGISVEYEGTVPSSRLKVAGIDLFSAGDVNDSDSEAFVLKSDSSYKKILLKNKKPVAAIALGDRDGVKAAQDVMEGKIEPGKFLE